MTQTKHAVLLGASKGCGYHALIRLLAPPLDWKVTILLRKPETIQNDPFLKTCMDEGRLRIVRGDATDHDDVVKLFGEKVDVVISTIGAAPAFGWRGISIDQPRLCIDAAIVLIKVLQTLPTQPRVIVTSSMGIGKDHSNLPYVLGVMYKALLDTPHQDKAGLEYLIRRSSSIISTLPPTEIPPLLRSINLDDLQSDFIPEVIIVRPALLMGDGKPGEQVRGAGKTVVREGATVWTVNRAEVGRFIVDSCLPGPGDEWVNKAPTIGWK